MALTGRIVPLGLTRTALAAALIGVAACGGGSTTSTVTLSASGDAADVTITYRTPDGEETIETALPWSVTFDASGEYSLAVEVRNTGLEGSVACGIEGIGRPVQADGEAAATCRISVKSGGGSSSASSTSSGEPFTRIDGVKVALVGERVRAPVANSPRAFVIVGDTAWAAEGNRLRGWDAIAGSSVETDETRGTNDATTTPDGTVFALVNNATVESVVEIAPDGTERVIELEGVSLDGPIVAGPDQIWVVARDPDRIIRLDRASGSVLSEIPVVDRTQLRAATEQVVVVCVFEDTCSLYDWSGSQIAADLDSLDSAIAFDDGLLHLAPNGTLALLDATGTQEIRSGTTRISGQYVSASASVVAVAGDGATVTLVERDSLNPLCEINSPFGFLGASDSFLWFRSKADNDWVLYDIDDLGCPDTAPAPEESAVGGDDTTDADEGPAAAELETYPWHELLPAGTCFNVVFQGDELDLSAPPPIVDCADPHSSEVVSTYALSDDYVDYDKDIVGLDAEAGCMADIVDFLGVDPWEVESLAPWMLFPDDNEWLEGSRTVACMVYGEGLVGTARSGGLTVDGLVVAAVTESDGFTELHVIGGSTGESLQTLSTPGTYAQRSPASWTHDASAVYFAEGPDDVDRTIMKFHRDTGLEPVIEGVEEAGSPAIDPTGTRLAYIATPGNTEFDIFVLDLEAGQTIQLTVNPEADTSPRWSPDGSRIAFRSRTDGNSDLWIIDSDGSGLTRLTDSPSFDGDPSWSPDGTELLFTSDRTGDFEIWRMNADGTNQRAVSQHPANDEFPSWSPDGSVIVFQSDRHGERGVWVMNAAGSEQSRLSWVTPLGYPSVSPG